MSSWSLSKKSSSGDEEKEIDVVSVTTDVSKWLSYTYLTSTLSGLISSMISPLGYYRSWTSRFIESGLYGVVAGVSSDLYRDTLFFYYGDRTDLRREEVRSRTLKLWLRRYAVRGVESAALFGTYDAVRIPASRFAVEFFSGSLTNCADSADPGLCRTGERPMRMFVTDNDTKIPRF